MDKRDVQWAILRAWDTWAEGNLAAEGLPTRDDAEKFYRDLSAHQPDLLDFKSKDKWADVHGYLLRHRKVVN